MVDYMAVIALDYQSRKFTNCTSLKTKFLIKEERTIRMENYNNTYESNREFVLNNKDLVFLS